MASLSSSFSAKSPLVLVGAGKMGAALLKGWLDGGLDRKAVVVVDPAPPGDSAALLAAAGVRDQPKPPKGIKAKVIVVAVKPQIIGDVLPGLRSLVGRGTVTLSIAAGTTLANLAAGIGEGAIVRSIPNTPAQVGRGITAAIANDRVSKAGRALVTRLLEAVGEVVWVDDEDLIDAVTAVSGSGPAYVFWLTESLAEAAVAAGLDADSAARLRPRHGHRRRRAALPVRPAGGRIAQERHLAQGHDGGGAQGADGEKRPGALDEEGRRRGEEALARAVGLNRASVSPLMARSPDGARAQSGTGVPAIRFAPCGLQRVVDKASPWPRSGPTLNETEP